MKVNFQLSYQLLVVALLKQQNFMSFHFHCCSTVNFLVSLSKTDLLSFRANAKTKRRVNFGFEIVNFGLIVLEFQILAIKAKRIPEG